MLDDRYEPLRDRLIEEMECRGWSLVHLARRSDLSHGTISCFLNHARLPSINFFEKIARGLGVPIFDLLALAGYMPPVPPRVKEEKRLLQAFRELGKFGRGIVVTVAEGLAAGAPEYAPDALETQVQNLIQGLGTDDVAQILELIESIK